MIHDNTAKCKMFTYEDWTWFWARRPDSDIDPYRSNAPDNVTSCYNHDQTNQVCGEHNSKPDPLVVGVMFRFAGLPSQTQRNTGEELLDHIPSVRVSRTRVSTET